MLTIREPILLPESAPIWPLGHYGASRTVEHGGDLYVLNAGQSDNVTYYPTDQGMVVVTFNRRYGYLGLGMLDPEHDEYLREGDRSARRERNLQFWQDAYVPDVAFKGESPLEVAEEDLIRRVLNER